MTLFCTISEIGKYWSRIAGFNLPYLYLAPPYGVTPLEFCQNLWHQKTRVHGVMVWHCFCDLFWYNTGLWRTDGWRPDDSIYCTNI